MSAMGTMFGVECSNCDSQADVDVEVLRRSTGERVRDVYACNNCAASIDVSSEFVVVSEGV